GRRTISTAPRARRRHGAHRGSCTGRRSARAARTFSSAVEPRRSFATQRSRAREPPRRPAPSLRKFCNARGRRPGAMPCGPRLPAAISGRGAHCTPWHGTWIESRHKSVTAACRGHLAEWGSATRAFGRRRRSRSFEARMKVLIANKYFFRKGGSEAVMFMERAHLQSVGVEVVDFSMHDPRNEPSRYVEHFVSHQSYDD